MDRLRKIAVTLVAAGAPALAAPPLLAEAERLHGTVARVDSGDTLMLAADGREFEVRLSDIGAPQGPQFYAPAARDLLEGIVRGRAADVVITGRTGDNKVFGRLKLGELDVNLELVRRGAVWVCWEYSRDTDYLPWENEAKRLRLGVWARTLEINALSSCRDRPPAERPLFPRS